ncbi:unnamed protein product [Coccothraustes coccothraustes]
MLSVKKIPWRIPCLHGSIYTRPSSVPYEREGAGGAKARANTAHREGSGRRGVGPRQLRRASRAAQRSFAQASPRAPRRARPRGGGSSAGTHPRIGAESPAPVRASPGHPKDRENSGASAHSAIVVACRFSRTPRKLPASEPSLGSSPSRQGWARQGHLTPPPAPGTAGRRASPSIPWRRVPRWQAGKQGADPFLAKDGAAPAPGTSILTSSSGTVGTRHVSNLSAHRKQTAVFSLLKSASCSERRRAQGTEPNRCERVTGRLCTEERSPRLHGHGRGPGPGGAPGRREPPRTVGLHGLGEGKAARHPCPEHWRCGNCPPFHPEFSQEKQIWLLRSRYCPGLPPT